MRTIKITDELKTKLMQDFENYLQTNRFSQNKIQFTTNIENCISEENKPAVVFTLAAYTKMNELITREVGEVGWHGTVTRQDNTFLITDIVVYPQKVTGATVTTDEVEYGNWLHMDLTDEQINTLRFHGHSHVNFGVTPSGVDTTWYNQILQTLKEDDYYIFMIKNKRGDIFIEIYDLKNNVIYETKDITIEVLTNQDFLSVWYETQKDKYLTTQIDTFSNKTGSLIYPEPFEDRLSVITSKHKRKKYLGGLYD